MARITLEATPAQSQRIQEAVASYNAQHGKTFTVKEWIYMVLEKVVAAQLNREIAATANATAAAAISAARQSITTDMQGGT